ncbi:DinB family protein [Corynebacterium tapiri]|uniref:DinB family protein n=1 Tax=Corynebacterium tapiri TaxID=1448266 RepID=A0A5C4U5N2_9CORY|nr:DinB family protein [Corynebacterium tapiri]TNL99353.1 DinB family protein [Corynebacterium tapiri]
MDGLEIFRNFASRPIAQLRALPQLTTEQLNARPGDHPNSISWLLWHAARQADVQLSELTGHAQLWKRGGYRAQLELGPLGDSFGLGHTPQEAAEITLTSQTLPSALDYLNAVIGEIVAYFPTADLDEVVDDSWDPPTTRGVRLVSLIDDCQQHVGAIMHIAGSVVGKPVGLA